MTRTIHLVDVSFYHSDGFKKKGQLRKSACLEIGHVAVMQLRGPVYIARSPDRQLRAAIDVLCCSDLVDHNFKLHMPQGLEIG